MFKDLASSSILAFTSARSKILAYPSFVILSPCMIMCDDLSYKYDTISRKFVTEYHIILYTGNMYQWYDTLER